jgi:hypothetical protein
LSRGVALGPELAALLSMMISAHGNLGSDGLDSETAFSDDSADFSNRYGSGTNKLFP